jgi:Ca2+-binding EF-hand superfamily protein
MLQRLFGGAESSTYPPPAESAGRQEMPGAGSAPCNARSGGSTQMSGGTMSAMVSLQMQPPSASDIAQTLTDALDTNGDGVVSKDEIEAALKGAGIDQDVTKAFNAIDTDGDGQLNTDELTSAISNGMAAHHGHGPHGAPPSAQQIAQDGASLILSSFDADDNGGLSLSEIASALGKDDKDETLGSAFGTLDSDGNGVLSSGELSAAIQADIEAALKAYSQQASQA